MSAGELTPFIQPRAVAYRKTAKTLLVAGEGDDGLAELNAQSVTPTLPRIRAYKIGSKYDKFIPLATAGGAPSGIALSADEKTAYVFCRSTYDIAVVALAAPDAPKPEKKGETKEEPPPTARLAADPHEDDIAMGRRLFYNATDTTTERKSMGMQARFQRPFEWFADYMYPNGHVVAVSISESWVEGEASPVLTM